MTLPFGPEAPGSIRRRRRPGFHQPPGLSADARRVLVPFIARLRDVGGVCGEGRDASSACSGREPRPFLGSVFTQGPLRRKRGDVVARLSPGEEASPKTARYDAPRWHDGLPVNILPIRTLRGGFESQAPHDRQVRVAREARIGRRALAEAERGPAAGLDDPRMPARRAQTRRWGSHVATPVKASVARWRRGWDSNPRSLSTLRFSRAPPSTARPPLRRQG